MNLAILYLWDFLAIQCLTYFHGFTPLKFQQQRQKPVLQVNIFTLWMSIQQHHLTCHWKTPAMETKAMLTCHLPAQDSYNYRLQSEQPPASLLVQEIPNKTSKLLLVTVKGDVVSYLHYHSHLQWLGAGKAEEFPHPITFMESYQQRQIEK